jgi:hypothetical protein
MSEQERAKRILTNLSSIDEDLLAFADDLWKGTNYRDQKERDRSLQFIDKYNKQLDLFSRIIRDIEAMIRQASGLPGEDGRGGVPSAPFQQAPHSLAEDFTFTRPLGIAFRGQAYKDTPTWKRVYDVVCGLVAALDLDRWAALPDNPAFTSIQDRKAFSRDQGDLRGPLPAIHGIYAEAHYSANSIRDNMVKLLKEFGIEERELKIYLRQDRDAHVDVG